MMPMVDPKPDAPISQSRILARVQKIREHTKKRESTPKKNKSPHQKIKVQTKKKSTSKIMRPRQKKESPHQKVRVHTKKIKGPAGIGESNYEFPSTHHTKRGANERGRRPLF